MSLDIYLEMDLDTGGATPEVINLYSANYTHNACRMWERAGVYDALYMSDGRLAGEVVATLWAGVARMTDDPAGFEALNPPNGWGSYATALPWLREVATAFRSHPKARIKVWK